MNYYYKHSCVVDSLGFYVDFVLVLIDTVMENCESTECIQYRALGEGEQLLDAPLPTDFARPRWANGVWIEGATPEELAAREQNCPQPTPQEETQTQLTALKAKLTATDYQAIKYAEGWMSGEEYAPIRAQRQAWRDEINRLEADLQSIAESPPPAPA